MSDQLDLFGATARPSIGHNQPPALPSDFVPAGGWVMTLAEAQELPRVGDRPNIVQRYAGAGAPLRSIVGVGACGALGRWVLLACGHWRELRDYDIKPVLGQRRPVSARCGCCLHRYAPDAADVALVAERVA